MNDDVEPLDPNTMRSTYRTLHPDEVAQINDIKALGQKLLEAIGRGHPCREGSLAKTKVEEAIMWATKGVSG